MEENEIIDVEVEEEVIASDANESEPAFTDEEIDQKVVELKQLLAAQDFSASAQSDALAKEIAINSKDYLDNDTYLWTMYAYALHYRTLDTREGRNAERFCFIRMKAILEAEKNKKQRPAALTFVSNTLNQNIIEEIKTNTAFLKEVYKTLFLQFVGMMVAMMFMFVSLFFFVFHYSWTNVLMYCGIIAVMAYFWTFKNLKRKFLEDQTNASREFCEDEELLTFDLPVRNS